MGLERLTILFIFLNVSGVLPIRIVLDKRNEKLKRFDYHWRQPASWWFLIVFIILLLWIPTITTFSVMNIVSKTDENVIYSLSLVLSYVSQSLAKFGPLLLIFQLGKFKTAFETLDSVDQKLKQLGVDKPCSSRKRTVIGFGFAFLWVLAIHVSALPLLPKLWNRGGIIVTVVLISIELIPKIQMTSWLLLFHLIYYNIAHRISVLTSLVAEQISVPQTDSNEVLVFPASRVGRIQILQKTGYLMNQLAIATNQIEFVFSFPVLLVLTTSFLSCTICLFGFIRELFEPSLEGSIYLLLVLMCVQVATVLTILLSADLPTQQARRFQEHVMQLSTQPVDLNERIECAALLLVSEAKHRFRLSAGGLFTVTKQLIPTLIGTVITYLVILLQNSISRNKMNGRMLAENGSSI